MRFLGRTTFCVASIAMLATARAQAVYSSDDGADSNHATPHLVQSYKPVQPHYVPPVMYSDDGPADTNFATPHQVEHAAKVDMNATASTRALPDCKTLFGYADPDIHTRSGISGASGSDSCRDSE